MEAENYEVRYIGDKISAIKVLSGDGDDGSGEVFVTGSYDSKVNNLMLWSINKDEKHEEEEGGKVSFMQKVSHKDDVTALDHHNGLLAASSSGGGVSIYQVDRLSGQLLLEHRWTALHHYISGNPCPCTDISIGENLATCGEDGTINVLSMNRPEPIRCLLACDSSVLTSILWVSPQCVAVVNTSGQLKVFDVRQSGSQAVQTFALSRDLSILNCLDRHPSQNHLIATGGSNGMLDIYDLRQEGVPVTILEGHNGSAIQDIKFHPGNPDSLFSCAANGSIWQWNGDKDRTGEMEGRSCWFLADAAKGRVEVKELFEMDGGAPFTQSFEVNSIDIQTDTLVAGTDSGAMCLCYQIKT